MSMGRAAAAGGGNSSDAICMGGYGDTSTEEYNGTSWSSGGDLNTGRYAMGGAGNSANAICMSGYTYDEETDEEALVPYTEEYNGTSWSNGGDLATARYYPASGGNASNAICMGGYADSGYSNATEEYNGTSWGSGGNLANARYELAGGGSSTDAICMGGNASGISNKTETYNGNSWSAGGNLGTARMTLAGGGSSTSAVCMGGYASGSLYSAVTEEYAEASTASVVPAIVLQYQAEVVLMARDLRYNTAVQVTVGPFRDKADGVTIKNSLTISNERITLVADTDDGNAPTIITG